MVVTYHPTLPSLGVTTRQHLHVNILHTLQRLQKAFSSSSLLAFRRPSNLRNILVRAELTSNTQRAPGNWCCDTTRCKTCPILMTKMTLLAIWPGSNTKWKDMPLVSPPMSSIYTSVHRGNRATSSLQDKWLSIWHHAPEDWRIPCGGALRQRSTLCGGHRCYGYRQITQHGPHSTEDKEKQMDQGSVDRIPSGNEPQSPQPPNLLPSGDLRILQIS